MIKLLAALMLFPFLSVADKAPEDVAVTDSGKPPLAVFIAKSCDHMVLWILGDSGNVYRFQDKHIPLTNKQFLAWLESGGNVDVVEMPCTVST